MHLVDTHLPISYAHEMAPGRVWHGASHLSASIAPSLPNNRGLMMITSDISRRSFLAHTAAAGVAASVTSVSAVRGAVLGANDKVRLGLIGLGGRMNALHHSFAKVAGVEIAAICDPDQNHIDAMLRTIAKVNEKAPAPATSQDLRKVLDDPSIDAVVIATCNHWHCLATIWACEAGKHVYVEKPLGNNLWEEEQTVLASRRHNRIVQVGTQQRSDPMQAKIKQFLHEEQKLGAMKYVVATRFGTRAPIGKRAEPLTPPSSVDYNLWLGPAQEKPIYRDNFHYDWHWDWNTGAGEMGNWGVHILDDVRNVALQDKVTLPKRVVGGGGRVVWDDAGETPNVHFAAFESDEVPVLFALSNLKPTPDSRLGIGHIGPHSGYAIYCEGGVLAGQRRSATAFDADGKPIQQFRGNSGDDVHQANFIEAIRAEKREMLAADVEVGHYSSSWCHLANVVCRAGQPMAEGDSWDDKIEGAPAGELLEAMKRYLVDQKVAIADGGVSIGSPLEFDAKSYRFTGDNADKANSLVRRECREGFQIEPQNQA